jgi:colanic acid biosynthesis glycosyl transferase WcaI
MPDMFLVDYGCHSFTYRLASHLFDTGFPIRYISNGSIESPNLSSLGEWVNARPQLVRTIRCDKPYGKLSLKARLRGELEWARRCVNALEEEKPSAVIVSTVPLAVVIYIQNWAKRRGVPIIYWLQDLQGHAMHDLLGRRLGLIGRVLGSLAYLWEQYILEESRMVIIISNGHISELPSLVRRKKSYAVLENWANIEEFPQYPPNNEWAVQHGLDKTLNIVYSGTLGFKHDLATFLDLAMSFRERSDIRVVVVSSDSAAVKLSRDAAALGLLNLIILPFQQYSDVPKVLASASVLVAPLDASAGKFCIPSKVLSYLCAGRPTVIAIDSDNPAAVTINQNRAGTVVEPGNSPKFINAVAEFLCNDEERQAAGRRARLYAEQTFSLKTVTDAFLTIISNSDLSPSLTFSKARG